MTQAHKSRRWLGVAGGADRRRWTRLRDEPLRTARQAAPIDGRSLRRKPYQCWLCKETVVEAGKAALDAHKAVCPRRRETRPCGVCSEPLPMTYAMSRKYHLGGCDEEADRRMIKRQQQTAFAVNGPLWPAERIKQVAALIDGGVHASYVCAEAGLAQETLRNYATAWRKAGLLSDGRLISTRRAPVIRIAAKKIESVSTHYPYITVSPSNEHELVLAVHRAVPRSLPESMRADVCQEMLAAVYGGGLAPEAIRDAVPAFIRRVRKAQTPWEERSLDAMTASGDGRDYLETHAVDSLIDDPLGSLHHSFDCHVCGVLVTQATLAAHDICVVIAEESDRRGLWSARANRRRATRARISPLRAMAEQFERPAWQAEIEILDTRLRAERAKAIVTDCEVCGFPLPSGHGASYHAGCAADWRERAKDPVREVRTWLRLAGRQPRPNLPVPGAFGRAARRP